MSAQIISSADPILSLSSKTNQSSKRLLPQSMISSMSFSSQFTKSRISIRTPYGSSRTRIQALYAPAESKGSLYQLLGITETANATLSDIKKAYKQMARKYHPDVAPPDRVEEYTSRFLLVHEAYETLSDPQTRALYDTDLAAGFRRKSGEYPQKMAQQREWKMSWEGQLEGLKQRSRNPNSWAARVRRPNYAC